MSKKLIPEQVRQEVVGIVERFNAEVLRDPTFQYTVHFRGRFAYIDEYDHGRSGPICRLGYTGDMAGWDFAIYRYSRERYDPDEWLIPGMQFVDGTVEGSLRAGMEAYPRSSIGAMGGTDGCFSSLVKALFGLGRGKT